MWNTMIGLTELDAVQLHLGRVARLLRDAVPEVFRDRLLGLEVWQLLGVPLWLGTAWLAAYLVTGATLHAATRLARHWAAGVRLRALVVPVRFFWFSLFARVTDDILAFPAGLEKWTDIGFSLSIVLALSWAALRTLNVSVERYQKSHWPTARPETRALVRISSRAAKVLLVALTLAVGLSVMGFQVTTLLAGLGIGGIALALGAQRTLENVFGGVAIAIDQPFREGDYITVDGMEGTVLRIGLRSTSLRTSERTIVTIPNGKLATMSPDNYAARDKMRFKLLLRLSPDALPPALEALRETVSKYLADHDLVAESPFSVHFAEFNESWLTLEIDVFTNTIDQETFRIFRDTSYLKFLDFMRATGTKLAQPRLPHG